MAEPLLRGILGGILRRIRLEQGRTLKNVSLDAQVSMPYLSEVERGLKEASSEVLAAICHALDLTVADLLALAYGELAGELAAVPVPLTVLSDTQIDRSVTPVTVDSLSNSSSFGPVSLYAAA